ncbi:hypothetical protein AGABI2DRAFT_119058 [Agaricus bisporus var. bisporus H97]|uniref:hypothetical protein n=1 Tax=Agaricus bisporus var. bisporus (strain H97 / ATCC MYA-4626 / FGSC 10389) TaxID=936046 RepID=UPI00029F5ED7|nr:hypothetical protein AGABI2DRAFT_119058 [Agaricus bisporus var. bisporus H97]EKV46880.1 hypothetical protein AGABI2DRAFT_119058 [Agaricus bisporus var. bisporus H97]
MRGGSRKWVPPPPPPSKRSRSKSHGDALNLEVGESKKKDKKDEDEGSDNDDDDDDWRKYFEEEPVAPEHRAPRYITAPRSSSPRQGLGGAVGFLALNALFILMIDYNLYADCFAIFSSSLIPPFSPPRITHPSILGFPRSWASHSLIISS